MANYLYILAAPDSHIEFLANYPDTLLSYVDGRQPNPPAPRKRGIFQRLFGGANIPSTTAAIPQDWPIQEAGLIGPEINHRNVSLYHQILNGGEELVTGAGTIFQTWLDPLNHAAINIDGHGENFAFTSDLIPELLRLTALVDTSRVRDQYSAWLRKKGDDHVPGVEECEIMAKEFADFSDELRSVVAAQMGIIWVCS
jgi:hypothetical protein